MIFCFSCFICMRSSSFRAAYGMFLDKDKHKVLKYKKDPCCCKCSVRGNNEDFMTHILLHRANPRMGLLTHSPFERESLQS
jgi:hypothetical protein